ncbi:MAG TPA: hypothetical protein VGL53_10875 [Bryobacteraceae bacterium]
MPISPHNIIRPVRMTAKTFVPPKGNRVKVGDNDTWETLAVRAHTTAWALIRYNYPGLSTDQPTATREVNWYLESYVGCTLLDRDQRNYRFSSADNPGFIWLPVPGAAETADEAVRRIVLGVLRGPGISGLNFGVGRIYVASTSYERVAQAIERGFITVHANPAMVNMAQYDENANRIDVAPGMTDFALVVHECTHAIFDIGDYSSTAEESEGIAYIAQALYVIRRWGPQPRYFPSADFKDPLSWLSWQMLFDEASRLATKLVTTPYISADEASTFFWAIAHTNFYRGRAGKADGYNGIDPAFY